MYTYTVKEIVKVYDGDTITVIIDLGFNISVKQVIRLYGINAPEVRGTSRPQGLESRDWLRERLYSAIENGNKIIIKTHKDKKGKYGRWIGELYIDDAYVNEELVENKLAVFKNY